MLRKIFVILSLLFIYGCTAKNDDVVTIIHDNDNFIASIHYPITKSNRLNKIIKNDVKKNYNIFKKNCNGDTKESFYIDFKYEFINDRYINVVLEKNVNNSILVDTYVFDIKKNKTLNVYDLFTKNDLDILANKIRLYMSNDFITKEIIDDTIGNISNWSFIFDDTNFYFYLNNVRYQVPISIFDLKVNIVRDIKEKKQYTYKEINKIIDPKNKVVALTFDDGPSKYTRQVVDLLNEYNGNATFFILGNKVSIYGDTLKYLLDSGNEIGNHSYNHKWLTHVSSDELINQISSTQDIIYNTLNYKPILFRPTYGSVNDTIRNNIKLDIVLWNVDTLDWKYKNGNKIASNVLDKIKDGSIVLMHDTHAYTYDALKIMLPKLKSLGYQFVTVSELNEVNKLRNAK